MRESKVQPTGRERTFDSDEVIVSKTDAKGILTYVNDVFVRVSAYEEAELLGRPHNLIRHPEMPRCVFRLLWQRIESGSEIFAYVVNLARDGAHYWVFAHVTPTFDAGGTEVVAYHSNRRAPLRSAVEAIKPLYRELCAEEQRHANPVRAMDASAVLLQSRLDAAGMTYDEFVWSLSPEHTLV